MKPLNALASTFALLACCLLAASCTRNNPGAGRSYCDETGCYQCDINDTCRLISNPSCKADSDCMGSAKCTSIGCATGCTTDADCVDDTVCTNGFCAPRGFNNIEPYAPPTSCKDDAGCPSDKFCDQGECKPRCTSDDECGPGMVCSSCGKCQPKDVPATCGTTQVFCSASQACNGAKSCKNSRCHFKCTDSNTCPLGQLCVEGLCADDPNPAAPECSLDLQCDDGSCINGYCHPSCKVSTECDPGNLCLMGVCQPDYTPGS